jgi:hypothetical protein
LKPTGASPIHVRTILVACCTLGVPSLPAQRSGPWIRLAGQAIPILTRTDAVPRGAPLAELRLVQPVLMLQAGALRDRLRLDAMADFEGWTMPNGELTTGAYGEGLYDRRHPHTYVHEVMLRIPDVLRDLGGPARLSLAAGKGFAPFGTDDPMSRPPILYPVNHHLSQILERAVGVAAVRVRRVSAEAGVFNGDEPAYPGEWPNWSRFADSWSGRLTLEPITGVEAQVSRAHVHSPEHRLGAGPDHEKWNASVRWARGRGYGLLEWARTSEANGIYVFRSLLIEAAWRAGRHRPYLRFERTTRPEEERVAGTEFRSIRPLLDNNIVGSTRWTIGTVGYGYAAPAAAGRLTLEPTVELAVAGVRNTSGGFFDPDVFYRRQGFFSLSIGVRLDWGMAGHRMGRYGNAATPPMPGMPRMDHSTHEAR